MSLNSFARLYEDSTIIEGRSTVLDILDNHVPPLQPTMSVLDLACATGTVTKVIYERCSAHNIKPPRVVGIDIGPSFIEIFNENKETLHWETAQGVVGDASDMTMCSNDEFDLVIMNYGLFAVADAVLDKVASEIYRVLKPGGKAVFSVWLGNNFISDMFQGTRQAVGRPQEEIDFVSMEKWALPQTTEDILVAGGFKQDKIQHFRHEDSFRVPDGENIVDRFDAPFWKSIGTGTWTDDQKLQWRAGVEDVIVKLQQERGRLGADCWIFVAEK